MYQFMNIDKNAFFKMKFIVVFRSQTLFCKLAL